MDLKDIRTEINQVGNNLGLKTNRLECYLFGSVLFNAKYANDIDVMILYENKNQIPIIKKEFDNLEKLFPLHICYFTFSEEAEFDFISQQKAEMIFKI